MNCMGEILSEFPVSQQILTTAYIFITWTSNVQLLFAKNNWETLVNKGHFTDECHSLLTAL